MGRSQCMGGRNEKTEGGQGPMGGAMDPCAPRSA